MIKHTNTRFWLDPIHDGGALCETKEEYTP